MSKLDKLINELCPNGVEIKKLNEVALLKRGTSLTKLKATNGDIPVISGGKVPAFYCDTFNRKGETITVAGSGAGAGYVQYWNEPIFASDCFTIKGRESIETKFLYYFMSNIQDKIYSTKKGGGVPHVHISDVENFVVPIPPISVQREIIRILDNFTELTARKKQYEYYRDKLLSYSMGVKYYKLCDIGKFYGGLSGKTKDDFADGNCKYITYMNVYNNIAVDFSITEKVKIIANERQNCLKYGDIIFTGSSETQDECGYSSVVTEKLEEDIYLNSFCFFLRLNDINLLNPDFAKYLFRSNSIRKQIINTASGVTRFNVSKKKMENIVLGIPSMDIQQRIIKILDKFDMICSDLNIGLPAEIEARKKQYEFYRDQLLTFVQTGHSILTDRQTESN